jgi:hypothetical protein
MIFNDPAAILEGDSHIVKWMEISKEFFRGHSLTITFINITIRPA